MFLNPPPDNRRSGGVLFYIKKLWGEIKVDKLALSSGNFIKCKSLRNNLDFLFIYRYNSHNIKLLLEELEGTIIDMGKKALVMGDININLLNAEESELYLATMEKNGFCSIVNYPTRGNSCLDHVFSRNLDVNDIESEIISNATGITDHEAILVNVQSVRAHRLDLALGRNNFVFCAINQEQFIKKINGTDFSKILEGNRSVNECFADLNDVINKCKNDSIRKIKTKIRTGKPWITHNLLKLIEKKEAA